MMVNKVRMFRDLVLHLFANEMMSHLLGRDFLLSRLTANAGLTSLNGRPRR